MPRAPWLDRAVAVVGVFFLTGCHTYIPVETASPGTTVRARLPIERGVEGSRSVAPEVVDVQGEVVSFGDTLVLATQTTQMIGNFREVRVADTLRVSLDRVAVVEERVFSTGRTIGLTAVVLAAAAGIVLAVAGMGGGGDNPGDGNGGGGTGASISAGDLGGILTKLFGGG